MFPAHGSLSEESYKRACKVMPGGSSRRSLFDMRSYVQSGDGCRVRDIDGNFLLDGSNNFMVLIHGHRHAPTIAALEEQLGRGLSFGLPVLGEVQLAEHLCARVASVDSIVFCSSGSEAVMHAMKAARALTQRPKIVKCEGLYHGSYDYAEVSNAPPVTPGAQGFPRARPYGPHTLPHVMDDVVVVPFNDPGIAEAIIRQHAKEIAGIIIDPVPSRVGYAVVEEAFLRMLRAVCDELGIVLIFDEVASFRVAHGGAQSLFDVQPDLTAFGKIIGGGLPVGAVGGKAQFMQIFDPSAGSASVSFTGTFNAHPLTMAAGLATLRHYTTDDIARLNGLGDQMRASIRAGIEKKGLPAHVAGVASFVSLFFGPRVGNGYHSVAHRPEETPLVNRFWSAAMDRKLLLDTSARLNLSTAFTPDDVDEASEIIIASLEEAFDTPRPTKLRTASKRV
jgi:glutamate-1-semialdehyde 2,1-aminomutase